MDYYTFQNVKIYTADVKKIRKLPLKKLHQLTDMELYDLFVYYLGNGVLGNYYLLCLGIKILNYIEHERKNSDMYLEFHRFLKTGDDTLWHKAHTRYRKLA